MPVRCDGNFSRLEWDLRREAPAKLQSRKKTMPKKKPVKAKQKGQPPVRIARLMKDNKCIEAQKSGRADRMPDSPERQQTRGGGDLVGNG